MSTASKIILAAGLTGLALAAVMFGLGADTMVYFDQDGVHAMPRERQVTERQFDETITAIEVRGDNQALRVERGEKFGFRAEYYQHAPEYSVEDGVLKIDIAAASWHWQLGFSLEYSERLTVMVPDQLLDRLQAENDNGSLKIDQVSAKQISVQNSNGSIELSELTADRLTATNGNGSIRLRDLTLSEGTFQNSNGRIFGDRITGRLTAYNANGSIEFNGVPADAYLELGNNNGSIRVDGDRKDDYYITGDALSKNALHARNSNGSIKVNR